MTENLSCEAGKIKHPVRLGTGWHPNADDREEIADVVG